MERIRKLKLINRNRLLWLSKMSIIDKLKFYPSILLSHLRHIIFSKKYVTYLGDKVYFDNIATPLSLMTYPYELSIRIGKNIQDDVKTILDIGGNIGQFSITANKIFNPILIDIIEPNPKIYNLLVKNTSKLNNVNAYNVGFGSGRNTTMYFEENRSGLGSILEDNVRKSSKTNSVKINLSNDVYKVTGKEYYDLVKIDVEGYECELLKSIKNIKCKYLYIEFSSGNRKLSGEHSELLHEIRKKFGEYRILYISEAFSYSPSFEILFKFVKI